MFVSKLTFFTVICFITTLTMASPGHSRPTIVIVPGAWHIPQHYEEFTALLNSKGYKVVCKRNPSCDAKDPNKQTVEADVAAIRNHVLLPILDAGEDVVLAMHSYGGCPGAAAAVGLSKAESKDHGKKGSIIGLAFMNAFVANEGDSLVSKLPNQTFEPWHKLYDDGQISPETPKEIFYADVPSPLDQHAISLLHNQSRASFTSNSPAPAWPLPAYNGRRAYLQGTQDQAIPFIAQQMMIKYSGVEWNVKELNSSHSPFLSHPKETADWLIEQANAFVAAP